MTKIQFKNLLNHGVILLDGASGTELQKRGMPSGICPEKWILDNPYYLEKLQSEYINAGSKIIYTFTFGANPYKLKEFNLDKDVFNINKNLAKISKKIAGKRALVAGDIAPTGYFPEPFGDINFDDHIDKYKQQVKGLLAGGVDLFVIETMMDIQEARTAIFAVKELCNLPIIVSMTFDESKRTLTGSTPEAVVVTLQALGIDAIGVNCSTGPEKMLEVIKLMKPYAKIPIIAKPNAGIPKLENGKTIFSMNEKEFSSYTKPLISAGACLIGGCCGTSPEYIKLMNNNIKSIKIELKESQKVALSSYRKVVEINNRLIIVGERINPTGKKSFQESLKNNNFSEIRRLALEQSENGAKILDINVGMPGIDEKKLMYETIKYLCRIIDTPLCIDSSDDKVIEKALKIYPGRALVNSISCEIKKLKKLLPIVKKYGAMFILLPVGNSGIPNTSSERIKNIKKGIKIIEKYNFKSNDLIIDGLVMTVSSKPNSPIETLKFIKWCKKNKFKTIIGLSNVSFGLPERHIINSTFLHLAKKSGLNLAIANPSANFKIINQDAKKLLIGKDKNFINWIKKYSNSNKKQAKNQFDKVKTIYQAVIDGEKEIIIDLIKTELKNGKKPNEIVDKMLIPAINYVGDLYDKKIYFLPQIIASAETMKTGFSILEPLLIKHNIKGNKVKIILATVKGDIHDIGKNIVALMLKNYGYEIYDLGKDVDAKTIIKKANDINADIIGLSALMTTTMTEMKNVINLAKNKSLKCKFIVGGAVITKEFADEIGADGYAKDAYDAIKLVNKLKNNNF